MPSDPASVPAVVKLTRNAPTKMAGATPLPYVSSAAIATPVGGHTADALGWSRPKNSRPTRPARKYTPVMLTRSAVHRNRDMTSLARELAGSPSRGILHREPQGPAPS